MSRIRTIKPEFCASEQLAECSTSARLAFALMWMFCDDNGTHPANTKRLKMEIFPGDAFTDSEIRAMVDELLAAELLIEFSSQGQTYWNVPTWHKHQKIDKPTYRYPKPTDPDSTTTSRILGESSPTPPRPLTPGMESNGMESNGDKEIPPTPNREASGAGAKPKKPKPPPFDASTLTITPELNTPEFRDAWSLWIKHRIEIKHRLTESQSKLQLRTFEQWGPSRAIAAINHTVSKGWQGLVEPSESATNSFGSQQPQKPRAYPVTTTAQRPGLS